MTAQLPPIAVFTETWWWNLVSFPVSAWMGAVYAEHRQKKLGWMTQPAAAPHPATGSRPSGFGGEISAPTAHSLEQIALDRRARKRGRSGRETSSRGQSDDAEIFLQFAIGLVVIAALAIGYLYARPWVQPVLIVLGGAACGFVFGLARGLKRRGLLETEWWLLFAGGVVVAVAAFAVAWLSSNPPLGGTESKFFVAVADAADPVTVWEQTGWSGRFFYALQALAVILCLIGVTALLKHYLALALEVNYRLKLPLGRAGRALLRFDRRLGFRPLPGMFSSLSLVVVAGLVAAGGATELTNRSEEQAVIPDSKPRDTNPPHLFVVPDRTSERIVLRVLVSEAARLRIKVRAGNRQRLRRTSGVPSWLEPVETAISPRPTGRSRWPSGRYAIRVTVTDRARNSASRTLTVRVR